MRYGYDPAALRKPVNLSINGDLISKARKENLNLSSIAEEAIGRALAEIAAARFREDIALSIAQHEAAVREYGSLTDAIQVAIDSEGNSNALAVPSVFVGLPSHIPVTQRIHAAHFAAPHYC
jgi:post-segregation antitoxin (ccd killing protein)